MTYYIQVTRIFIVIFHSFLIVTYVEIATFEHGLYIQVVYRYMNKLPEDILGYIAGYMSIHGLMNAETATKNFAIPRIKRKKSFIYSQQQINPKKFTRGGCLVHQCGRMKLSCIKLDPAPIETQILSIYCSKHTKMYKHVNLNDLL